MLIHLLEFYSSLWPPVLADTIGYLQYQQIHLQSKLQVNIVCYAQTSIKSPTFQYDLYWLILKDTFNFNKYNQSQCCQVHNVCHAQKYLQSSTLTQTSIKNSTLQYDLQQLMLKDTFTIQKDNYNQSQKTTLVHGAYLSIIYLFMAKHSVRSLPILSKILKDT